MNIFQKVIKRLFDLIVAAFGVILLFIPSLILAFIVKISSPGSVFYCQKRVGKNANLFTCIKFRTMYIDSEKEGSITTSNDSRITPIGKFLRKYKLDEFPQLWNVLIGKMSFVGPRPDVPGYADKLVGKERRVLDLRPGITGPATLFFRNEEEILASVDNPKEYNDAVIWPKKVELNLSYIENWGFWKDITYILITLFPLLNKVFMIVEKNGAVNYSVEDSVH